MNTLKSGFAAMRSAHEERHEQAAERHRIEHELASFVTESEKAELSAMLERYNDELSPEIEDLISDQVLSTTEHRAA